MPDARSYLNITGFVSPDKSAGYIRLSNGALKNFLGAEESQLQIGSNTNVQQEGNAIVPILSRLAISYYPDLPPPVIANIGDFVPAATESSKLPEGQPPPRRGYFLTDGSELTPSVQGGLILSLSGKAADNDDCTLEATVSSWKGMGRGPREGTWVTAALKVTKGALPPFIFNFSYSATAFLFQVDTSQNNIGNSIVIDLGPAVVEEQTGPNLIGTAKLTRTVDYHDNIYSSQTLQVPAETIDAEFHLANQATLWTFMPTLELFSDIFEQLGGPPTALTESAFVTIGSLNDFLPPPSLDDLIDQITTSIAPSLGPLAATCLSVDDSAVSLKSAANWLNNLLINSADGKSAIKAMATVYEQLQIAAETSSENQPTRPVDVEPKSGPSAEDPSKPMPIEK